jgi:ketosteroid isomerase-like protein
VGHGPASRQISASTVGGRVTRIWTRIEPAGPMIMPPLATTPDALLRLWAVAISEGDVDAACSLYAPDAVLVPWHLPLARGGDLRAALSWLAELRLPVRLHGLRAGRVGREAVLHGHWTVDGIDGEGNDVRLAADVVALVRCDAIATEPPHWRTYLERWVEPSPGRAEQGRAEHTLGGRAIPR